MQPHMDPAASEFQTSIYSASEPEVPPIKKEEEVHTKTPGDKLTKTPQETQTPDETSTQTQEKTSRTPEQPTTKTLKNHQSHTKTLPNLTRARAHAAPTEKRNTPGHRVTTWNHANTGKFTTRVCIATGPMFANMGG
eukprot:comp19678_c0_seq1/m.23341 comp19678_c0_seq1/g.23341  ORF comp19678_c0_seq1/g.23341 comp19678_c0_seq1/m.23341 type:complete len:137 (-) comp19678_c0_seq1:520-930(-)